MLVASLFMFILPKHVKTREPKDEVVYHSAPSYMQHLNPRQLKTYI